MAFNSDHLKNSLASQVYRLPPRLRAISVMTAGLLMVVLCGWIASGSLLWQQAFWFLTVPSLLYVFLAYNDDVSNLLYHKGSVRAAVIAAGGFSLALFAFGFGQTIALATGMAGGMFTFMDYHAFRRLVLRHAAVAATALVGALSGIFYYLLQLSVWKSVAGTTVNAVYFFLNDIITHMVVFAKGHRPPPPPLPAVSHPGPMHRFHVQVPKRVFSHFSAHPPAPPAPDMTPDFMAVASDHFTLRIYAIDTAMLGMFLLLFLLSLELVLSGRQVKLKDMLGWFIGGSILVFIANALVLSVGFFVANRAMTPGASSFAVSLWNVMGFFFSQPLVCFAAYLGLCLAGMRAMMGNLAIMDFRRT